MATTTPTTERAHSQFARFVGVGAVGFVIDAGILTALMNGFGWGPYAARAISFSAAVSVTWALNRRQVFRPTARPKREYSSYFVVQSIGASINLGIFAVLIELVPALLAWPFVPLAIGGCAGLVFNFFGSRAFVFVGHDKRD